jgi:hypothetical protein
MMKAKFKLLHPEGIRCLNLHIWPHQNGVIITGTYKDTRLAHSIKIPNTYYGIVSGSKTETWFVKGKEVKNF